MAGGAAAGSGGWMKLCDKAVGRGADIPGVGGRIGATIGGGGIRVGAGGMLTTIGGAGMLEEDKDEDDEMDVMPGKEGPMVAGTIVGARVGLRSSMARLISCMAGIEPWCPSHCTT